MGSGIPRRVCDTFKVQGLRTGRESLKVRLWAKKKGYSARKRLAWVRVGGYFLRHFLLTLVHCHVNVWKPVWRRFLLEVSMHLQIFCSRMPRGLKRPRNVRLEREICGVAQ